MFKYLNFMLHVRLKRLFLYYIYFSQILKILYTVQYKT